MSGNRPPHADAGDRLDRYLDGSLSPAERAEFERELRVNPALRRELDSLAAVDSGLRRVLAPQPIEAPVAPISPRTVVARIHRTTGRPAWLMAGIAAALALAASLWLVLPPAQAKWEAKASNYYAAQEKTGFRPEEVCTTDEQFRQWTTRVLKESLEPINVAGGPKWVGWNYNKLFSDFTAVLVAQVDGRFVLVMLDRQAPELSKGTSLPKGLRAFSRTINGLKLVEITPLDTPRVLNAIRPVTAP